MQMFSSCEPVRWRAFGAISMTLAGSAVFLQSQTVLLQEQFDTTTPGQLPRTVAQGGVWTSVSGGSNPGAMRVMQDTNGWFGNPSTNRFLKVENGIGFSLLALNRFAAEVVTLSFDFVDRRTTITSGGAERFTVQFYAGDGSAANANRAHVLSLQNGNEIRTAAGMYGAGVRQRWDVIVNNSAATVSYNSPKGARSLPSGLSDVWLDGRLAVTNYTFARQSPTGSIRSLAIQTFSTDRFHFDIDNIVLYSNAHVLVSPAPRTAGARVGLDAAQKLLYTPDIAGNTIPDFSNVGYMGGGVPIPDVPVRLTLNPAPGDDTTRIQAAIDQVSAMPLDENGFRGALLLAAGTYSITGSLRIATSGVVLRGEGQGTTGTVLIAAGTSQRALITVAGTGSWSEVSNSRRNITNDFLPVGARSFQVDSVSGLSVGDQVIVHRPSTAAWIDAIGMNAIPPRSDGGEVVQWAPGAYDLRYDRIITAIQGNTVTVDAPLANSLEKQFGGGSIYRYNFNNRISNVGVEKLRAVSEYASSTDEDHAWDAILIGAVRNGWVREVTGVHFVFSAVSILNTAKWITVEDCSMLDPVSVITGSRRYPFYIYGQLNLVQRCYARFARHDFSTSSRVAGPNVFYDCSADNSYNDSGPHQRWATGTLYDNVRVPNHDLNVQNRLNFGTGHGWSGANHVVWNSTASRFAIHNPPTAQNWAFGLKGAKWAGSFPSYAIDGYWESHGTPVLPASLYVQQLQERLDANGPGGLITLMNFASTNLGTIATATVPLSLRRLGILDGSRYALLHIAPDDRNLFTPESLEPVFCPANLNLISFQLAVRTNAYLPQARNVVIALAHGAGYSAGVSNVVRFTLPARPVRLDDWRAYYFDDAQLADAQVSGPLAAPAGDDVPNVVKYAFGLSPWEPRTFDDFPSATVEGNHLTLVYERQKGFADLVFRPKVSGDLIDWSSGLADIETVSVIDMGAFERVTLRDRTSMLESPRRYMALEIEWGGD